MLATLLGSVCTAANIAPISTDAFVDTIGINVHASHLESIPYDSNWQGVIDAVDDIGLRYVRDIPNRPDRLNALVQQSGARLIIIAQNGGTHVNSTHMDWYDVTWQRIQSLSNIAYFEGPNEMDGPIDPYWANQLKAWHIRLYNDAKADPNLHNIPWIAPSLSYGHNFSQLVDLAPYIDYGNVHFYPGGSRPLGQFLQGKLDSQQVLNGNKPVIFTETGYFSAPHVVYSMYNYGVSETAQAKYIPRLLFDYHNLGIAKTILYELVDFSYGNDGNYHLGILRTDGTYKPAAHALKNLISLLEDVGPEFATKPLDLTLTGTNAESRHSLMQKRDGEYWLALWQDALSYDYVARKDIAVPTTATTVTVDRPILSAKSYLPRLSTTASDIALTPLQMQLVVDVPDEVLFLALELANYGDANLNGIVNFADFVILHDNFGKPGDWTRGDFTGDGIVNFADFQRLQLNFQRDPISVAEAEVLATFERSVPEPGALLAAVAGLLCLSRRRR